MPLGWYYPNSTVTSGNTGTELCVSGTYKPHNTYNLCKPCQTGTYNTQKGSINCTECPQGFFCPVSTRTFNLKGLTKYFYPTNFKGCAGIVFTLGVRMGGRLGGWVGGGK